MARKFLVRVQLVEKVKGVPVPSSAYTDLHRLLRKKDIRRSVVVDGEKLHLPDATYKYLTKTDVTVADVKNAVVEAATELDFACRVVVVEYENFAKHNLRQWTNIDQDADDADAAAL